MPTGTQRAFRSFTLEAVDGGGTPVTTFLKPYTLTVTYQEEELEGRPEQKLNLAYWDGKAWQPLLPCTGCSVDAANNRVTVRIDHFTEFALLGTDWQRIYLPMVRK